MNIEINHINKSDLIYKQSFLLYALHVRKPINRIKVLAYIIRHSTEGVFIVKSGFAAEMAKVLKLSRGTVGQELLKLQEINIIKFVSAGGKKSGSYRFAPQFEGLCDLPKNITFNFKI